MYLISYKKHMIERENYMHHLLYFQITSRLQLNRLKLILKSEGI